MPSLPAGSARRPAVAAVQRTVRTIPRRSEALSPGGAGGRRDGMGQNPRDRMGTARWAGDGIRTTHASRGCNVPGGPGSDVWSVWPHLPSGKHPRLGPWSRVRLTTGDNAKGLISQEMSPFAAAPRVGFEPTTLRLTAACSTTELPRHAPDGPARAAPAAPSAEHTPRDRDGENRCAPAGVPFHRPFDNATVLSVADADRLIARHVRRLGTEPLPLSVAAGRVLREAIRADRDLPPVRPRHDGRRRPAGGRRRARRAPLPSSRRSSTPATPRMGSPRARSASRSRQARRCRSDATPSRPSSACTSRTVSPSSAPRTVSSRAGSSTGVAPTRRPARSSSQRARGSDPPTSPHWRRSGPRRSRSAGARAWRSSRRATNSCRPARPCSRTRSGSRTGPPSPRPSGCAGTRPSRGTTRPTSPSGSATPSRAPSPRPTWSSSPAASRWGVWTSCPACSRPSASSACSTAWRSGPASRSGSARSRTRGRLRPARKPGLGARLPRPLRRAVPGGDGGRGRFPRPLVSVRDAPDVPDALTLFAPVRRSERRRRGRADRRLGRSCLAPRHGWVRRARPGYRPTRRPRSTRGLDPPDAPHRPDGAAARPDRPPRPPDPQAPRVADGRVQLPLHVLHAARRPLRAVRDAAPARRARRHGGRARGGGDRRGAHDRRRAARAPRVPRDRRPAWPRSRCAASA